MDFRYDFHNLSWCNPNWCFPSSSKETNELLRQCMDLPLSEINTDLDEFIKKSKEFPIPFPLESVRVEKLKERRPPEDLKANIASTYPLIHERILLLITHFLIYKRELGSPIEKMFYKDMGVAEFIDRILTKRAVVFMGPNDKYKLITGEEDQDGWESIGTFQQKPPLLLENCLSYDEMKISSMVYVSGHTDFINDGNRNNRGIISEENIEKNGVIIGIIGSRLKKKLKMEYEDIMLSGQQNCPEHGYGEEVTPTTCLNGIIGSRLERKFKMEYEDIMLSDQQNCPEHGYGEEVTPTTCLNVLRTTYVRNNQSSKHMWRQMWSEFYQVQSYTYDELTSSLNIQETTDKIQQYTDRYVKLQNKEEIFDNTVFFKRLSIPFECSLLEANERAKVLDKMAFLNIIGIGLGVWQVSPHQADVFVLSMLERIKHFLKKDLLNHVSYVNLAYISASDTIIDLFTKTVTDEVKPEKSLFIANKRHPKGGIKVLFNKREPSSKLPEDGLKLITTYPWDGNAHPGNEFWLGSLSGSGDPAAASSSQISELHNAHINLAVNANNLRVAGQHGVLPLQQYCKKILLDN